MPRQTPPTLTARLAGLALATLATLPALAEEAAPPKPLLTLDAALREARDANLDLRAARQKLTQASLVARKVWANYLPKVAVGGGYTYNEFEAKIAFPVTYFVRDVGVNTSTAEPYDPSKPAGMDNLPGGPTTHLALPNTDPDSPFGGPVETVIQQHHQLGGRLTLDQAILAPALIPAIQQAELAGRLAELGIDAARRELLFAVAQVYYGAVGLKEAMGVQEKLLASNVAHEKDAKVRVDAGTQPQISLLRAQIDRSRSEQDVMRAKFMLEGIKSTLATLLNRPSSDFDVAMPDEPAPPEGELEERAKERPDVKAAQLGVELAEKGRLGAWLKYAPNIGFNATYTLANVKGFTGQYGSYALGIGLNWVLFDGLLRETEIEEAASKLEEAAIQARSAEVKARDEIRRARLDLQAAVANRAKADEQVKLARAGRELIENNFKAGVATYIEVSDSVTALQAAEIGRLSETLNAQLAVLKLAKAAGAFDPK